MLQWLSFLVVQRHARDKTIFHPGYAACLREKGLFSVKIGCEPCGKKIALHQQRKSNCQEAHSIKDWKRHISGCKWLLLSMQQDNNHSSFQQIMDLPQDLQIHPKVMQHHRVIIVYKRMIKLLLM